MGHGITPFSQIVGSHQGRTNPTAWTWITNHVDKLIAEPVLGLMSGGIVEIGSRRWIVARGHSFIAPGDATRYKFWAATKPWCHSFMWWVPYTWPTEGREIGDIDASRRSSVAVVIMRKWPGRFVSRHNYAMTCARLQYLEAQTAVAVYDRVE
jgi:hypothetical protein